MSYEGEFNAYGRRHGQGTLTNPNGSSYKGGWKDGQEHGQGTETWVAIQGNEYVLGDVYEGEFSYGLRHGQGTFTRSDGVYKGEFNCGDFQGRGTFTYATGDVYTGSWKKSLKHGQGTYTGADGATLQVLVDRHIFTNAEGERVEATEENLQLALKSQHGGAQQAEEAATKKAEEDAAYHTEQHQWLVLLQTPGLENLQLQQRAGRRDLVILEAEERDYFRTYSTEDFDEPKGPEFKCLGKGLHGEVYEAWDKVRQIKVAVKYCKVGADEQIQREYATLSNLRHPNVVRSLFLHLDLDARPVVAKIFLELVSGGTLSAKIPDNVGLPEHQVKQLLKQGLQGLSYLHSRGVIHRDIKPANVLIAENGTWKFADFSTSKTLQTNFTSTTTGVVSTPMYECHEVLRFVFNKDGAVKHEGRYSPGSDLWALACTTIQMLSGKLPWSELGPIDIRRHIIDAKSPDHHPVIPECSPPLRLILLEMLSYDREKRGTAAEILTYPYFQDDVASSQLPLALLAEQHAQPEESPEVTHETISVSKMSTMEVTGSSG